MGNAMHSAECCNRYVTAVNGAVQKQARTLHGAALLCCHSSTRQCSTWLQQSADRSTKTGLLGGKYLLPGGTPVLLFLDRLDQPWQRCALLGCSRAHGPTA